ncbi:glycosyltransferase family 25 protein [Aeromonas sanarellii]|uniref:glycosyltransferase family 25 protein n=1 Tax=Aeromonas sanarellii TaxID=633415 RepID=UPI002DB8EC04|nr:glycosyltransferase family 25 protein [Aeromonas sanarellii]MEB6606134.1 glycosyltransferase family 25 protein [Aeromonas sanarellii]
MSIVYKNTILVPIGCSCITQMQLGGFFGPKSERSDFFDYLVTSPKGFLEFLNLIDNTNHDLFNKENISSVNGRLHLKSNTNMFFWHADRFLRCNGDEILEVNDGFSGFENKYNHLLKKFIELKTSKSDLHFIWSNVQPDLIKNGVAVNLGEEAFHLSHSLYKHIKEAIFYFFGNRAKVWFVSNHEDIDESLISNEDVCTLNIERGKNYFVDEFLFSSVLKKIYLKKENLKFLFDKAKYLNKATLLADYFIEYKVLELLFSQADKNTIPSNRDEFYLYILLLGIYKGKKDAISYLDSLYRGGLYHRIFLLAKTNVLRRFNEFHNELIAIKEVFNQHPSDSYVINSYFNILLANGEFHDAESLVVDNIEKFDEIEINRILDVSIKAGLVDLSVRIINYAKEFNHNIHDDSLFMYAGVIKNQSSQNDECPIYAISLLSDKRKRDIVMKSFGRFDKNVEFVDGVIGKDIPKSIYKNLTPNGFKFELTAGLIGCSLSHIHAIERFYYSSSEYALVIEDDALPLYNFSVIDIVKSVNEDFDIIMVNERMSSIYLNSQGLDSGYTTVTERLNKMSDKQEGWGGDGYILSKKGAKSILDNYSIDGILGHFDGQLISYGYEHEHGVSNKANTVAKGYLSISKSKTKLKIYALNFPLVSQVNFGYSSLKRVSNKI